MTVLKSNIFLSLLLLIAIFCGNGILMAAEQKAFRLNSIHVEGHLQTSEEMILENCGLVPGALVTPQDVKQAIQHLWRMGRFSNVQLVSERRTDEGLDLIIAVQEYPRLVNWDVAGNKTLKKKDIDKTTGFYDGMVVTPFKIYQAEKALRNTYRDKGYLLANVEIRAIDFAPDEMLIQVNIHEGAKVQVENIRVFGNGGMPEDVMRSAFRHTKEDRFWRGADFDREKYEADLENILAVCRQHGFRDAEIVRDSLYFSIDKKDLFIDVFVNEGRRYHFGDITIEGNNIFTETEIRSKLLFGSGDVYNQHALEESIRDHIQNLYYNKGYLFANILPLEIPNGEDLVDIRIRIDEGHAVQIQEIHIAGNTRTSENVIRRELNLHPGDTFDRGKLERSVTNIFGTGYFDNVIPDIKLRKNTDETVDLEVAVEEKSSDLFNTSFGYSENEGFIGNLGMTLNNFSLKHPLAGGDGQRLSLQWDIGKTYRNLAMSFTEPWAFGTPTLVGFSIFDTKYSGSYRPWDGRETGGNVQLGRRFRLMNSHLQARWTIGAARNEVSNIRDESQAALFGDDFQESTQISLSQTLRRDTRNRPDFPTSGTVLSLNTKMAGGPLQGDEDFLKNLLHAEHYLPLKFGSAFVVNGRFGLISGLSENYYVNPNELFFMGGTGFGYSQSLRGYDPGTVGPLNESGTALGGQSMAKFGAEFRVPLLKNPGFYGLLFAEAGNVWRGFNDTNFSDLKRSIGFGFRLNAPFIGLIGVDFAYGMDHFDAFGNRSGLWKIHFNFGQF